MATDPVAEVEKYIETVATTRSTLQEAGEKVSQQNDQLENLNASLQDKVGGFVEDVDEFRTESLEQGWGGIKNHYEDWTAQIGEMVSQNLTQGMTYLEEQEETSGELLTGMEQDLERDFQELSDQGFDLVDQGHSALEEEVGDLKELAEQAFQTLGEGIGSMESKLEEVKTATLEHFETMSSELTDDITTTMENAFEEISTALSDEATNDITEGFGELGTQFTDMFGNLADSVEQVASDLMEKGVEVFTDMVDHAKDEAMQTISDEVTNAVEEFVQALLADFAESMVMMTVGAATTTALAPYVGPLIAAKAICGAINDLLEVMNLGA